MPLTNVAPIKQALVSTLRANSTLQSQVSGIYEGFAPSKTKYPFVAYNLVFAPYDFAWGSTTIRAAFDIYVFGENSVEANNLDALVLTTLHDTSLSVTGQSTLYCRRVGDLSFKDIDDEGKQVYQIGGTYEVWTHQAFYEHCMANAGTKLHGKNGAIYIGGPKGTGIKVAVKSEWTLNLARDYVDATVFGDTNKTYLTGLRDLSGTYAGFFDNSGDLLVNSTSSDIVQLYLYSDDGATPILVGSGPGLFDANISASNTDAVRVTGNFRAAGAWTILSG